MTTQTPLVPTEPGRPIDAVRDAIEARLSTLRQNVADFERHRSHCQGVLDAVEADLTWHHDAIHSLEVALSIRSNQAVARDHLANLIDATLAARAVAVDAGGEGGIKCTSSVELADIVIAAGFGLV